MRWLRIIALACALAVAAAPFAKKKKQEEITQTREILKDPPTVIAASGRKLTFQVSPLSAKGLLSQQVRDALKALMRGPGGIVKIRAFVAGSGDLRRVRDIVSETFTEKRLPLPVLTVVQVGALPLEGAQVVLEATSVGRKDVHPNSVVWLPASVETSADPLSPVASLVEKSLAALESKAASYSSILRVTCFLSTLDDGAKVRELISAKFRQAAINYLQVQRAPAQALAACEATGQATSRQPDKLLLTGSQVAFGFQEADLRLAFQRLEKELEPAGASYKDVIFANFYPLANSVAAQVRKLRFPSPHSTMLLFDGLPSMDASFAVDLVASLER